MRKILKMAAIAVMSVSMAICGSGEVNAAENKEIINIDPTYVAVDDENIKMEITSVSREVLNEGQGDSEYVNYKINFTVTNKSEEYDANVSVAVGACSIGQYTVQFGNMGTDTKAGKINDTACFVASPRYNEGAEHIESLEDLLQFEAQAKVDMYYFDGEYHNTVDRYAVDISLADLETSEEGSKESEGISDDTIFKIGDTVETDFAQFTLNEVRFSNLIGLKSDNWLMPINDKGGLSSGDGKIFVWYSFTVKNLEKQSVDSSDFCNIYVDYNDGYIYDDSTYTWQYGWSTSPGISENVGMPIMEPLEEYDFWGYTKCVEDVQLNQEFPLLLVVTLPGENGDVQFTYKYAAEETYE